MMMGTSSGSSSSNNLNLFTPAQWEELEQQALIYKYMVSGVPVPTQLILSVRRSLYSSSFSNSSSTLGVWEGNFQYNHQLYQIGGVGGYGRKIDLEPGRCRRTDGKKWRCSKEAYPDSKYCERHMHRGRNRSRKPVEFSSSSSSSSSNPNVSSSPSTTIANTLIAKSISASDNYQNALHPRSSPIQNSFTDYRYLQDERPTYFPINDPYTAQKMTVASSSSDHQNYSQFNFQNLKTHKEGETEGEHCFVMGTDFVKSSEETKSSTQIDTKVNEITNTNTNNKQPFHHFFASQKPNDPAWVDVDQHHNFIDPPKSPLSTQDLFQSKPRPYW